MATHWTGRKHTDATKRKMRLAHLGKRLSPEHLRKIRMATRGRTRPPWVRERIREALIQYRIDPMELHRLYIVERKSAADIAMIYGCTARIIYNRMRACGIPSRSISEVRRGRIILATRGANHHNWKGGISNKGYGVEWREQFVESMKRRDGLRCVICRQGRPNVRLHLHHIDFSKTNHNPRNLITLCNACHHHHAHNKAKRDEWIRYFQQHRSAH